MENKNNLALYRLWRPQTFSDVVSQTQVVYPLRQSVRNRSFAHAFLFCGTRGTGKTSIAKIFAKAINCLNPKDGDPCNECSVCKAINNGSMPDVLEMDAASHNGVDDIRSLISEVAFAPVVAKYKVYIIDEAHMITKQAFNALLKTLEEPPAHAIFILATTNPEEVPATIVSRCQRYEFRQIPQQDIINRLKLIAASEQKVFTDDALSMIARFSEGALRDAIGLLDQAGQLDKAEITADDVIKIAGRVPDIFLWQVMQALLNHEQLELLNLLAIMEKSGRDLKTFATDLSGYVRDLLICKLAKDPVNYLQVTSETLREMQELAQKSSIGFLTDLLTCLARIGSDMRFSPDPRTTVEVGLLSVMTQQKETHKLLDADILQGGEKTAPLTRSTLSSTTETLPPREAAAESSASKGVSPDKNTDQEKASFSRIGDKMPSSTTFTKNIKAEDITTEKVAPSGTAEGSTPKAAATTRPEVPVHKAAMGTSDGTAEGSTPKAAATTKPEVPVHKTATGASDGTAEVPPPADIMDYLVKSLRQNQMIQESIFIKKGSLRSTQDEKGRISAIELCFAETSAVNYETLNKKPCVMFITEALRAKYGNNLTFKVKLQSEAEISEAIAAEPPWKAYIRKVASEKGVSLKEE